MVITLHTSAILLWLMALLVALSHQYSQLIPLPTSTFPPPFPLAPPSIAPRNILTIPIVAAMHIAFREAVTSTSRIPKCSQIKPFSSQAGLSDAVSHIHSLDTGIRFTLHIPSDIPSSFASSAETFSAGIGSRDWDVDTAAV